MSWQRSAATVTVLVRRALNEITRVPGAASPVTITPTSTTTFSPRLITSRSMCSM